MKNQAWLPIISGAFLVSIHLATAGNFTVSSLDGGDGPGTFRRAIDDVNSSGDTSNTITFSIEGEITLGAAPSVLTQDVSIQGLGAGRSVIKAPSGTKVITSAAGTSVTLRDLTLEATGLNFFPQNGGAIFSGGSLTLRNCHLHRFIGAQGGAIFCDQSLTVIACSINDNRANGRGGAILCRGALLIKNSTLSGNSAGDQGGALWMDSGVLGIIDQCTIVNNQSSLGSAGIGTTSASFELVSSIVAQNTRPGSVVEPPQVSGGNNFSGTNFIGGDPQLRPLRFYEHPLPYHLPHVNSPVIDAGPTLGDTDTDQRGNNRPAGQPRDLGAIQVRKATVTTTSPSGAGSLASAVSLSNAGGDRTDYIVIGHPLDSSPLTLTLTTATPVMKMTRGAIITSGNSHLQTIDLNGSIPSNRRLLEIGPDAVAGLESLRLINGDQRVDNGEGGVIYLQGRCRVEAVEFKDNDAYQGGAIFADSGSDLAVNRCAFLRNSTNYSGGAIRAEEATLTCENSFFQDNNAADLGGAISITGSSTPTRIVHCTFSENHVTQSFLSSAGALDIRSSDPVSVYNCHFVNNTYGPISIIKHVEISSSSVLEAGNVYQSFQDGNFTYLEPATSLSIPSLGNGSPAIDAGDPLAALPIDLPGNGRSANSLPDAGAREIYYDPYLAEISRVFTNEERCLPGGDHEIWGAYADPDGDGLRNLEELLFMTNPRKPDAENGPTFSFPLVNDKPGILVSGLFDNQLDSSRYSLSSEFSTNLENWYLNNSAPVIQEVSPGVSSFQITSDPDIPYQEKLFLRLKYGNFSRVNPAVVGVRPTNNPDHPTLGVGSVDQHYAIGKYEVTARDWTAFLNAVDPEGANNLFLWDSNQPISRITGGAPGACYQFQSGAENLPITHVNFFDACRFCNWLHNGAKKGGNTESGSYELLGGTPFPSNAATITRSPFAIFALPNLDEWIKAAHLQSNMTWSDYPAGCATVNNQAPPGNGCTMNYNGTGLLPIASFPTTKSPSGAFDMGGNVAEWTETFDPSAGSVSTFTPGGSWDDSASDITDNASTSQSILTANKTLGFRIVRLVSVAR